MRLMISVLTGVLTLAALPLEAQKTPKKEANPGIKMSDKDSCTTRDDRTECVFRKFDLDSALQKRPMLGVELAPTGTLRDTIGVFVGRVTPKGPAEKAGIIEGDRIVSINGVDLRVNAADAEDGYAADLPRRRLTREVGKLTPGNVANLRVWSGGRVRDVAVTIGRASDFRGEGSFGYIDGMPMGAMRLMPGMMDGMRMQIREFPKMQLREFPKMQLREFPRMRLEQMQMPRIRWEKTDFPHMEMELRKLDDGGYILEKSKKSKEEAEKKEKEKSKK